MFPGLLDVLLPTHVFPITLCCFYSSTSQPAKRRKGKSESKMSCGQEDSIVVGWHMYFNVFIPCHSR